MAKKRNIGDELILSMQESVDYMRGEKNQALLSTSEVKHSKSPQYEANKRRE